MESNWYYEDHGRAQGPVTQRELLNKIKKGDLKLLDLVFKEGEGEWHPIEYYTELTELVGSVSARGESDWILLRTVDVELTGKRKFEQSGPYNIDQILELVDKGRATFADYVWRTGFDTWVSLGRVDKFEKPLASSIEVDLSLYKLPRHDILENTPSAPVKTYSKKTEPKYSEPPPPPEAKGPDLARPSWLPPERTEKKPLLKKESADVAVPVPPAPPEDMDEKTIIRVQKPTKAEVKKEESPLDDGATVIRVQKKKNEPAEEKPLEVSKKPVLKKVLPPIAARATDDNPLGDHLKEEVKSPPLENIENIQHRWAVVGQYAGYSFVALGIFLFSLWGINNFLSDEKVDPKESFADIVPPPAPIEKKLPPPSEDLPQEAVAFAKKKIVAPPPPVAVKAPKVVPLAKAPEPVVKPAEPKKEVSSEVELLADIAKMNFKERSTFHHEERQFIFYTSLKAIDVANELPAIFQRKGKNVSSWKRTYVAWQGSLKKLGGEFKNQDRRLYPDLYNRLKKALASLETRAKDFDSLTASGRNPTKELNVKDIVAELRKINAKAKALDQ